jgi:hypothetical protein
MEKILFPLFPEEETKGQCVPTIITIPCLLQLIQGFLVASTGLSEASFLRHIWKAKTRITAEDGEDSFTVQARKG